jgi:hypothetical protein
MTVRETGFTGAPPAVAPALRAKDMSMPREMSSGTSEEPP